MRPKQTMYAGTLFKSLLEARWAVFFDSLGVRWKYEAKQHRLGYFPDHIQERDARIRSISYGQFQDYWFDNELTYTPDFILPNHGLYVEVKPSDLTFTESVKISRLAFREQRDFLILIGLDKFLRVHWFDKDSPQEINDLNFLTQSGDGETVKRAFNEARKFGKETIFEEFQGEDF